MPSPNTTIPSSMLAAGARSFDLSQHIVAPADGTYTLQLKAAFGYTIDSISVKTSSGTCNVAVRIDNVPVEWPSAATTVAASSSINTKAAADDRTASAGSQVDLVVSGSAAPANLAVSILCTRVT